MSDLRLTIPVAVLGLAFSLATAACGDGDGSPETAPGPEILIFGTEHLAQSDTPRPDAAVTPVVDSLRPFAPEMVVVEYLPPDWPQGRGNDYRWTFDDSAYADAWGVPLDSAGQRLAALEAELVGVAYDDVTETERCELARLHFLARDRVNALYYWTDAECPAESDSLLTEWVAHRGSHEMGRVAFPIARAHGLRGVVPFDYQGEDARWFMGPELFEAVRADGTEREIAELDSLNGAIEGFRARNAAREAGASYMATVRHSNSAEWIETQRHLYEEVMPVLTWDDSAGRRQTSNYWLRNERMFDRIDAAVERQRPDRILVVVGAGHKYFLDELAERRGYQWIDPLNYLGAPID